jgi:hypothetical protein
VINELNEKLVEINLIRQAFTLRRSGKIKFP